MNYYDTLIEVADDCPTEKAQVPQARGGKKRGCPDHRGISARSDGP